MSKSRIIGIFQDLRHAIRSLKKSPGFTAIAVFTLALGLGATTTLFSVTDSVLLRPLPYADADQLVVIWQRDRLRNQTFVELSYPAIREWRDTSQLFASIAGLSSVNSEVVLTERGDPIAIEGRWVTGNFFEVLGVNPLLGRVLTPADDQSGAAAVVVLSYGLWRDQFGAARAVLGDSIVLDGKSHTIVGVMPDGFDYPRHARFWVSIGATIPRLLNERNLMWMIAVGRLRPDISFEAAESELTTLWRQFYQAPSDVDGYSAVLTPFSGAIFGPTRAALLGTFGAVVLLCLIACLNVTALHVLRTTERHPELAVRRALGATHGRLVSGVIGEGLLIAAFGGVGAVLVALVATPMLVAVLPAEIPRLDEVGVGPRAWVFTIVGACLAGLFSSLGSAIVIGRASLSHAGSRTVSRRNDFRSMLVVVEVAGAVMLAVAAALTARTFINLKTVPLGFETSVLALKVSPQGEMSRNRSLYQELLEGVRHLPSVEAASAITQRPLWNTVGNDWVFTVEGQSVQEAERNPMLNLMAVSSDYFRTMGIPIIRGRALTDTDAQGQPGAVVISESLARRMWPGQDAIGRRVQMPLGDSPYHNVWLSVVGVVGDARYRELQATRFDLYISHLQADHRLSYLMIRTRQDPTTVAATVRTIVRDLDRNLPVTETTTMGQVVSQVLSTPAFVATSLGLFALAAAALAGLGLYGLVAYTVATRTREIGVRMALGAVPAQILARFVREGVVLTLIGGILGIAAAFAVARLMSSLVFGVSVHDPVSFVFAPLLLILVAAAATILPARRAASVDPLEALRYE